MAQSVTSVFVALEICSLVQKSPMSDFFVSSIKFTSGVITPAAAVLSEILTTGNHTDFGKSLLCSGAPQFTAGYAAYRL